VIYIVDIVAENTLFPQQGFVEKGEIIKRGRSS